MMKPYLFKIAINIVFLSAAVLPAQAQRLKEVQDISAPAPEQMRADGKDKEWKDSFLAHNKRTNIFYTLCNDDHNLYLVIKSDRVENNSKILGGGISFSVNTEGKKKEKESITVTYPILNKAGGNRRGPGGPGGAGGGRGRSGRGERGAALSPAQRDSVTAENQRAQLSLVKEIKIKGVNSIPDTLISIYNEYGIKASASINNDNLFFCELVIPLEKLGINNTITKEFLYQIKVNGLNMPDFGGGRRPGGGDGANIDFQSLSSPTDFWGKYMLHTK